MPDRIEGYAGAVREAYARGLNCLVEDFSRERLTMVDRPDDVRWYTAMGVTFGTGTVLSIDPAYRDLAESHPPAKHFRAMSTSYLQSIVAEGTRRGVTLSASAPSLCFTIGTMPPELTAPDGFEFREHGADWMNSEQRSGRFDNGVGEAGVGGRDFRNRFALALYDAEGEIAAIAGAFDTYGMLEIGVDVVRTHRGRGLGRLAVSTLAREIIRRDQVPFYGCAPTNVRSHRTAEASGFRVVCADAVVSALP